MLDEPVEEPLTNLEAVSLPPRKSCNTACKRATKNLKVFEDTRIEVGATTNVVEYPLSSL
jgi:hypothetical protein